MNPTPDRPSIEINESPYWAMAVPRTPTHSDRREQYIVTLTGGAAGPNIVKGESVGWWSILNGQLFSRPTVEDVLRVLMLGNRGVKL